MIEIYTDGSFHPVHKQGGYAYVIKQGSEAFFGYGGELYTDPVDAEMGAIKEALRQLLKLELHADKLVLYTDSKFAIHALHRARDKREKDMNKLWKRVQRRTGAICRLQHIKAHKGNYYNEWCDDMAKKGLWAGVDALKDQSVAGAASAASIPPSP